jgi:hypothetical protein
VAGLTTVLRAALVPGTIARRAVLAVACLSISLPAFCQDAESRIDAGIQTRGVGVFVSDDLPPRFEAPVGVGATLDVHVASRLSLAAQATWFPTRERVDFRSQGGQTAEISAGVRGKLVTSRSYALTATLAPGIIHFSNTFQFDGRPRGATHAQLTAAAGVDYYVGQRVITRFTYGRSWYRVPAFDDEPPCEKPTPGHPVLCSSLHVPGRTYELDEATLGVAYRIGPLTHTGRSTSRAAPHHRFLDLPNAALIAAAAGTTTMDAIYTERGYKRSPEQFVEVDPLARPFVRSGWAAVTAGTSLFVAGEVGLHYLLHRTGHHRAERVLPLVFSAIEFDQARRNARLLSQH